jgi:hypothetical protein
MMKRQPSFTAHIKRHAQFPNCWRAVVMLGVLLSSIGLRDAVAVPKDTIPGTFYAYDFKLDNLSDNPGNIYGRGQAEIVDYQGKYEIFGWGDKEYPAHCLRFKPDKIGDFITLRIHIARRFEKPDYAYEIESVLAYFHNEGIYQLEVDGKAIGATHDCSSDTKWIHGSFPVEAGDYKITYRYIGKGKKRSGKVLNLSRLDFN